MDTGSSEKPSVIVWNTNVLNQSRSFEDGDQDVNKNPQITISDVKSEIDDDGGGEGRPLASPPNKADIMGSPDWRQRKMRLQKQWPVPKLYIELESDEGFQGSTELPEDRNSLSPVIPHLYDKARSCSTSSCSTDSTDLGSQDFPMQPEEERGGDAKSDKDVFFKKKLRARYLSSQSSEDSEADFLKTAAQRQEFKLRSKSADLETPRERPMLQRQTHSLSTIDESKCHRARTETNLIQWWANHGDKHLYDGLHIKQEPYSPHLSPMVLSRRQSLESLSDAPDVFSPLTPNAFSLPLHFDGEGGVFRFPGESVKVPQGRHLTPPRSPRSPRYIPDSRLECLTEQPPSGNGPSQTSNSLTVPNAGSPAKTVTNIKEYHSPNIFTFSPLVIPPGEGSLKTLPRTPTSGFPLGLQDNPSAYPPKYLFSPQLYNDLAEAQRHRHNNGNPKNDNTFICPMCGQIFSSFDNLAKHMAKHLPTETVRSGNNNKIHYCKVCNRAFARSDMLTRHMRLHTGLKPYECQVCGQVFSRSDHLNTHQRTHTGEKPYKCPQCPYAACRRDMITRHMRIHSKQWPKRGNVKSSSAQHALKDDIRKCSLSSADSLESADTGRGNMSISSVDSLDIDKESRKSSFASSGSFESDISGRSLSMEDSVDSGHPMAHHWSPERLDGDPKLQSTKRDAAGDCVDNLKSIFLQIPGRSTSSSTIDSDEIPSPRPQMLLSPGGSLDERMFHRGSMSPLPLSERAFSDEGAGSSGAMSARSDGSPTPRARDLSALPTQELKEEAFFQHRNNRSISVGSEAQEEQPMGHRDFNIRRFGLKKQRNFSSTSFDSVDSMLDDGGVKVESDVSIDETTFLKCNVTTSDA